MKQKLGVKKYIRYADDFVLLSANRSELKRWLYQISDWLGQELRLWLHPQKVTISTLASGVDLLGWEHFPHCRIMRETTKRRMFRNLRKGSNEATVASYLGSLGHGDAYEVASVVKNLNS